MVRRCEHKLTKKGSADSVASRGCGSPCERVRPEPEHGPVLVHPEPKEQDEREEADERELDTLPEPVPIEAGPYHVQNFVEHVLIRMRTTGGPEGPVKVRQGRFGASSERRNRLGRRIRPAPFVGAHSDPAAVVDGSARG
jgi:hypothetical protein